MVSFCQQSKHDDEKVDQGLRFLFVQAANINV
jgi:hypothetical protein